MGLEVVVAGEGGVGQEVVHRFVELDAQGRGLMVEQEKHLGAGPLAHAHLDRLGDLEEGMEIESWRSQSTRSL